MSLVKKGQARGRQGGVSCSETRPVRLAWGDGSPRIIFLLSGRAAGQTPLAPWHQKVGFPPPAQSFLRFFGFVFSLERSPTEAPIFRSVREATRREFPREAAYWAGRAANGWATERG